MFYEHYPVKIESKIQLKNDNPLKILLYKKLSNYKAFQCSYNLIENYDGKTGYEMWKPWDFLQHNFFLLSAKNNIYIVHLIDFQWNGRLRLK